MRKSQLGGAPAAVGAVAVLAAMLGAALAQVGGGLLDEVPEKPGVQKVAPGPTPAAPTPAGATSPSQAPKSGPPQQPSASAASPPAPSPGAGRPDGAIPPSATAPSSGSSAQPALPAVPLGGANAPSSPAPPAPPGTAASPPPAALATPPAPTAAAPDPANPPPPAAPAAAEPSTTQPQPTTGASSGDEEKGGLLENVPSNPGVIVTVPGPKPVAPPPQSAAASPPSAPASAAPVALSEPGKRMLVDIMRSALGQGIYLTPPASGTPGAAALDEIAKQCQKPVDEIRSAMDTLTLARPVSSARQSFKSLDGKDQGSLFAVTVSPAGQLPEALGCVASARSEPLRLDLFVNGRDLGPLESVVVPASLQGKIQADVNSIYGDTARPWRLATAEELLAILPVLFNYSLWGPDGGKFWTSVRLADGSHAMLVTKISRRYYDVSIEIADAVQKATAIWVRNRSN